MIDCRNWISVRLEEVSLVTRIAVDEPSRDGDRKVSVHVAELNAKVEVSAARTGRAAPILHCEVELHEG